MEVIVEENLLLEAARGGDVVKVKSLLFSNETNINEQDEFNETALIVAVCCGHEKIVRLLLTHEDIDLHAQSYLHGTALTAAIFHQELSLIPLLLSCEKNFNISQHPGALEWAVRHELIDVLRILISDHGADVNSKSWLFSNNSLSWVSKEGYDSIFGTMSQPKPLDLPIIIAIQEKKDEIVSFLIDQGADLNLVGHFKKSAKDLKPDSNISNIISQDLVENDKNKRSNFWTIKTNLHQSNQEDLVLKNEILIKLSNLSNLLTSHEFQGENSVLSKDLIDFYNSCCAIEEKLQPQTFQRKEQ